MLKKVIAALVIALVGVAYTAPASADHRGWGGPHDRGWHYGWRGPHYRDWRYGHSKGWHYGKKWDDRPYWGSVFGGILGGFLSDRLRKDDEREDKERYRGR